MKKSLKANNGFGELPKQRGYGSIFAAIVCILIYVAVIVSYRSNINSSTFFVIEDIGVVCAVISAIMLGEIMRALVLFGEERNHLITRYSNSFQKAFTACFPITTCPTGLFKILTFIVSTIGTCVYWRLSYDIRFDWCAYTAVAFFNSLNQATLSKAEVSHLNETENKHVADGLAWSFYFGYLKLMLPGLDEMISNAVKGDGYAVENCDLRDKLSAHKVFIVIPKDCFTYSAFTTVDDRITFACSMPPKKQTRGGVQERIYKNTVWKVQVTDNGEPLYVLMEYATPCLSMYDMMKHTGSKFTQDDLECQVKEFSIKLQSILESDPECCGKFVLVLCGDVKKHKLGDIIDDAVRHQGRVEMGD